MVVAVRNADSHATLVSVAENMVKYWKYSVELFRLIWMNGFGTFTLAPRIYFTSQMEPEDTATLNSACAFPLFTARIVVITALSF